MNCDNALLIGRLRYYYRSLYYITGGYMYVEATYGKKNDTAILTSPVEAHAYPACLTFYYHMFGEHIGTLFFLLILLKSS